jgi:hypothetical protein
MTDEQIAEIYSLGRESFFGGQKSFQFQAYPFRMTPINMAKHRNNPNMPFWKMIKEGYDHFEVTRQEPKVDFCEKKYVFDAIRAPNAKRDPVFEASAKCPVYAIPEDVADAVREKQEQEQAETAKLVARGTPVARINTGIDGGMNSIFASKLPNGNTGLSEGGAEGPGLSVALARAPGTIPATVNPPRGTPDEPWVAATPAAAPASSTRVASAAPAAQAPAAQSDGFFSSLARKVGLGGTADATASTQPTSPPAVKPKAVRNDPAPRPEASVPKTSPKETTQKAPETRQAAARPALKPSVSDTPAAAVTPAPAANPQVAGSQPIVPANSFDSRFSAVK